MKWTQKDILLDYLKRNKTITGAEAFSVLGIYRLSARISELREDGHEIETTYETKVNEYGEKVTYGKYKLIQEYERV